jgi:hypothetical protein
MGNRKARKRIARLYQRIDQHEAKIAKEQADHQPDFGLIKHWRREIRAFTVQAQRYEARLDQQKRRGRKS